MTARDTEAELLTRCTAIAMETAHTAQDQRAVNVFQTAAMVVRSWFPLESKRLMWAGEQYFVLHPNEKLASVDIVRNGWVASLPRLPDMLTRQLQGH